MSQKRKPPAPPPEEYIKFERREPTAAEQQILLEAAIRVGVRPGVLGELIDHESAGTWHPQIRPNHPDKPALKITTDGQVRGQPGSSAVGIGQYLDPTWLVTMYHAGDKIIETAELDKHNPAAAATIRAARQVMQAEIDRTGRRPNWDTFEALGSKLEQNKDIADLLKLRSDPTNRVPIHAVAHSVKYYSREIEAAGLEANATNIYIVHHTSLEQLKKLAKADYVPGDDPRMRAAAAVNGGVFRNEDGSNKTSAQAYAFYRGVVSDDHASRFEREHYGRDFGKAQDASRQRVLMGNDGKGYKVKDELIMPRLPADQFMAVWKQPPVAADKPENLPGTVAALRRLGFDFGRTDPQDFNNSRLKAAITSFKHQAGLPHADKGEFDVTTQRFLQQAVSNADRFIGQQQQQKAAMEQGNGLNLRTLNGDLKKLDKSNPLHGQISSMVIDLKQKLADAGLLKPPTKLETVKDDKGRSRRVAVEQPFDATVDNRLLSALATYQRENGLMDTKGLYEATTLTQLGKGKAPPAAIPSLTHAIPAPTPAAQPPKAVPPAASAPLPAPKPPAENSPRRSSGVVTGQNKAEPTEQFATLAASTSHSALVIRKVSIMAESPHAMPHVMSYGTRLRQGNKTFDERAYEAQRLVERVGFGKLLGKDGADGFYGKNSDAAFKAYAESKGIAKKPGEVSDALLDAMRQDRMRLAAKDRAPDFFERYLTHFGAPPPEAAPTDPQERAKLYSSIYPRVMNAQIQDSSTQWNKPLYGITPNQTDFLVATSVLVSRGHMKPEDLEGPNAPERARVALKEYQADIGLIPSGRLDMPTLLSIEQTRHHAELQAGNTSRIDHTATSGFNTLGMNSPVVSTSALSLSLGIDMPVSPAAAPVSTPAALDTTRRRPQFDS